MGRRFSGVKRGGRGAPTRFGGGNEAADQRLRDRDSNRQPEHVKNGYPHISERSGHCLCFGPCCFGASGCICPSCNCDPVFGHVNGYAKRGGFCFACGDPATTTVEGERACTSCAREFKELLLA